MVLAANPKLVFPSKSENIAQVEKLIEDVCTNYQVGEDQYGNILIALTEAVINAIHHGNKSNPSKNVEVQFKHNDNNIVFTIKDQGEGFEPDSLPDPTAPENLEKEGGRGVFLMKSLADSVSFEDHGRTVNLTFKVANAAA